MGSGKVESELQNSVKYTGEPLKPGYPYSWEVSTWDAHGEQSPYSERAQFATGLTDADWGGDWIQGVQSGNSAPLKIVTTETNSTTVLNGGGLTLRNGNADWANYSLSAVLTLKAGAVGLAFRVSEDRQSGYVWQLVPGTGLVRNKLVGGQLTQLGEAVACEVAADTEYTFEIVAEGAQITTTLNGTQIDVYTDEAALAAGTFGFYAPEGAEAVLESLTTTKKATELWLQVRGNDSDPFALYNNGYEWDNYTVEFDFVIDAIAGAFMLRSANTTSGYMWQFSAKKNGLARHIRTASGFTKLDGDGSVACGITEGQEYHASFALNGNTITTTLDGKVIDTYTDANSTNLKGTFGFRAAGNNSGGYETARFRNIKVTAADGTVLYEEKLDNADVYSGSAVSVVEAGGSTYTTNFSDLSGWNSAAEELPIVRRADVQYWADSNAAGVVLLKQGHDWTDYIVSADIKTQTTSAGLVFRAPNAGNTGYMWAIRRNVLREHKGENGTYVRIGSKAESDLSVPLNLNQPYNMTVRVEGNTITTFIDGRQVDQKTDSTSLRGTIGMRTDSGERGQFTNFKVTDLEGNVLFEDDFSNGLDNWDLKPKALTADNSYWYNRKEVALEEGKEVAKAIAYVAGSQDYELTVNGTRIGRGQTFDYPGETKYQGWDFTEAVKGQNTAALGVLASYYGAAQGRAKSLAGLLARFNIYYTDGTCQTIVTDDSWLTHATGYSNSGARNGEGDEIEYCDGRLMLEGWAEVGYDTTGWSKVAVHGAHPAPTFTTLEAEIAHVEEREVAPVAMNKLDDGTMVFDFGKVIPATVEIRIPNGTEGTRLTIQTGYELNANGTINTSNAATQNTKMQYYYTMKAGEQVYESWYSLGFRYMSVPAAAGELTLDDVTATVYTAEIIPGRESTLITNDEMVNAVFEFMKYTALHSVTNQFVDTPTREKGQFLGDAINISSATTTAYFERNVSRKCIMQYLDSADRWWNSGNKLGMYNSVYPNVDNGRDIPEYSLNFPLMVWRYYMLTGDMDLLEYAYPYMKNTAGYIARNTREDTGLVTAIYGGSGDYGQGIVDWPKPGRFDFDWNGTRNGARATIHALSVRAIDMVANMAEVLGIEEDVQAYTAQAQALRDAMNEHLLTEDGVYADGTNRSGQLVASRSQHATSHAITAGVPNEEDLAVMGEYLASLGMRQGPMTADILVEALFKAGRADAVIDLLTNTEDYGWAQLVAMGESFCWEQWQYGQSQSHGWGGASAMQLLEYIGGVQLVEAGGKTIRIDPAEGALETVDATVVVERGAVEVSYSGSGADYTITIDVPTNITAQVVFPVVEGGKFVEVDGNNGVNAFENGQQIMTVGSGKRTFAFTSDVTVNVTGNGDVTVGDETAAFTVSVEEALDLATMTLTLEGSDNLSDLVAEAIGENYILAQSWENGVLSVVLCNNAGIDGAADLLTVYAKVDGKVGETTLTPTSAVFSSYSGESEVFVPAILGEAGVVKVDYLIYDVNCDGVVDQLDITRAQRLFGKQTDGRADIDKDGEVTINDLILIINNYTK